MAALFGMLPTKLIGIVVSIAHTHLQLNNRTISAIPCIPIYYAYIQVCIVCVTVIYVGELTCDVLTVISRLLGSADGMVRYNLYLQHHCLLFLAKYYKSCKLVIISFSCSEQLSR